QVKLHILMQVDFPTMAGDNKFDNVSRAFNHPTSIQLAAPRAGSTYTTLWWLGLAGGGILMLALNGILIARGNAFMKRGHPTSTYPVDKPGEQQPAVTDTTE